MSADEEQGPSLDRVLRRPITASEHWIAHVILRRFGEPSLRQIMIALVAGRDRDEDQPKKPEKAPEPDKDRIGLRRRAGAPVRR
ncbi:MAG: hypothetical protein HOV80_21575 [Polyangiaceae bacterium]|nr:hypothetical protein [Polyangiaceae bacterium]